MAGYWQRPEDTAQALRRDETGRVWLHTGDVAEMSADGYFRIVDRKKDIIVAAGGLKVYPNEIEDVLSTHPKVRLAAVIGVPVGGADQRAKAFVVLREGERADADEILAFLRRAPRRLQGPEGVEFRAELPLAFTGKVLRRVLADEERRRQRSEPKSSERSVRCAREEMTMETGDLGRLKQDAIDKIIFHATPRDGWRPAGPWMLERGEGALLVRRGRPRVPRRPVGRRLRGPRRVRARRDRPGHVRAGAAAALHEPVRNDERRHDRAGPEARRADAGRSVRLVLLQQRLGGGRGCDQARSPVPRSQRRGPAVQGRVAAPRVPRLDARGPVGHRLESRLRGLPSERRSDGSRGRLRERDAALLLPLRARADVPRRATSPAARRSSRRSWAAIRSSSPA